MSTAKAEFKESERLRRAKGNWGARQNKKYLALQGKPYFLRHLLYYITKFSESIQSTLNWMGSFCPNPAHLYHSVGALKNTPTRAPQTVTRSRNPRQVTSLSEVVEIIDSPPGRKKISAEPMFLGFIDLTGDSDPRAPNVKYLYFLSSRSLDIGP
jgi:hypothetical protein